MNSHEIKALARNLGASLVRVADLELLRGIETDPPELLDGFTRAVSLAVRLSDPIMDAIVDRPTPLYSQHYLRVNALLDDIALRISLALQESGARALPLPASQSLDRERLTSYLSHKAVAVAAGLGWQGKSLLVVSPEHGPRIRLVTVLTDAPLEPDPRLRNRCGTCTACADACPARAIQGVNTEWHYATREEAVDLARCAGLLTGTFTALPNVGTNICGVCIRVCPWGQRRKRGTTGPEPLDAVHSETVLV